MNRNVVLLVAMLAVVASVSSAQIPIGKEFDLAVGDSVAVGPERLTVGFGKIASESRCPIGVLCVWEGDAAAEMWADLPDLERKDFVLHSNHGFDFTIRYGGYLIELIRVLPYPEYGVPIDPKAYVITVAVNGGQAPTEKATWSRIRALYGDR